MRAQVASQAGAPAEQATAHLESVPRVPGVNSLLRGLNAGVTFSGAHDSSIGWYAVVTPALTYAFSSHYSIDASASVYPYRLVQSRNLAPPSSQYRLKADRGEAGDTLIGLHASFNPPGLWNMTTASFTLPTGNRSTGLGTGKVTFDFSEYLQHDARSSLLLIDLGAGNSSNLFNSLLTRNYSSLGPLAHFRSGAGFWLPGGNYLQAVAYEQLPMGTQTIYTDVGPPGSPAHKTISSSSASEDNGLTASSSIPLSDHLILSGYYNRSLRHHLDTASVSVTWVLHDIRRKKRLSLIDRALREAETGQP